MFRRPATGTNKPDYLKSMDNMISVCEEGESEEAAYLAIGKSSHLDFTGTLGAPQSSSKSSINGDDNSTGGAVASESKEIILDANFFMDGIL